MNKVLVICGPTASGKTSISIKIAQTFNGEIINGDSMQVYKDNDILTAKIKPSERENIPHHLFSIKEVDESFSVAEYQLLVRNKIKEIQEKGKLPIIVGGTGLYLKAALYDYEFEEQNQEDLKFEESSTDELYLELQNIDVVSAKNIHPHNRKRIIRALNIVKKFNKGKEEINSTQEHKPIYDVLYLGLTMDRDILYSRIDQRIDMMINEGLLEEVKTLYKKHDSLKTMQQAIGYKEFLPYLRNEDSLEHCIQKLKFATHKYAKRQYTWFNHQMDVNWIDIMKDDATEKSIQIVGRFLENE